jgi:hypothetical protein
LCVKGEEAEMDENVVLVAVKGVFFSVLLNYYQFTVDPVGAG